MKKIVFLCTGNTCRSPMAEGIAKKLLNGKAEVISRGIAVFNSSSASENAVKAVKKYGVDISAHKSKQICEKDLKECDIVLTMTTEHKMMLTMAYPDYKAKIFTIYEFVFDDNLRGVSDPYGGSEEVYEKCCDEIYSLVEKIADKI